MYSGLNENFFANLNKISPAVLAMDLGSHNDNKSIQRQFFAQKTSKRCKLNIDDISCNHYTFSTLEKVASYKRQYFIESAHKPVHPSTRTVPTQVPANF